MPHSNITAGVAVLLVVGVGYILKLLTDKGEPRKKRPNFYTRSGRVSKYYGRWPR